MREGEEDKQSGEEGGGREQDRRRSNQAPEIPRERADKHQAGVEGTANPCAFVVPESVKAPKIGHAKRDHAASQRDNSRTRNHAQNPQQWLSRNLRRYRSADCARDIYRRWANCYARGSHPFPATAFVRPVAIPQRPRRAFATKTFPSSPSL